VQEVGSFAQKRETVFVQQATELQRAFHLSQPKALAVTITTLTPFLVSIVSTKQKGETA